MKKSLFALLFLLSTASTYCMESKKNIADQNLNLLSCTLCKKDNFTDKIQLKIHRVKTHNKCHSAKCRLVLPNYLSNAEKDYLLAFHSQIYHPKKDVSALNLRPCNERDFLQNKIMENNTAKNTISYKKNSHSIDKKIRIVLKKTSTK